MAAQLALLALLVASVSGLSDVFVPKVRVCYFDTRTQERFSPAMMRPEDLKNKPCTHIVYCFAKVGPKGRIVFVQDEKKQIQDIAFLKLFDIYKEAHFKPEEVPRTVHSDIKAKILRNLKQDQKDLKILLGVAAYTPTLISGINNDSISALRQFIVDKKFDGIDMFMHSFSSELDTEMIRMLPRHLEICMKLKEHLSPSMVSVTLQPLSLMKLQNSVISQVLRSALMKLDMVHLATYDLFLRDRSVLMHHTSLRTIHEIIVRIETLLEGADKVSLFKKLTLGLAMYARSLTPASWNRTTIGSPVKITDTGSYEKSFLYSPTSICSRIRDFKIVKDKVAMAPYAYDDTHWLSFDTVGSMRTKLAVVKKLSLMGVSVWSWNLDHLMLQCHYPENYPVEDQLMTIRAIAGLTSDKTKASSEKSNTDKDNKSKHNSPLVRACYFNSRAGTIEGIGKLKPEMIRPNLCTHIIYAFAKINPTKAQVILTQEDVQNIKGLLALKRKNLALKILISIGEDLERYLVDPRSINTIATSLVQISKMYAIDGIDIFAKALQKTTEPRLRRLIAGLEQLCKEIRKEVKIKMPKVTEFHLTLTLHGLPKIVSIVDYLKKFLPTIDWINVAMYDLMEEKDKVGHQSPLALVKTVTNTLIKKGIPGEKIVLGFSAYARTWTLSDPKKFHAEAPALGKGEVGNWTKLPGYLARYEICKITFILDQDKAKMASFGHKGNQWFSLETLESFMDKVEYVLQEALRGVFLWSLEGTDHSNLCGKGFNPLLTHVKTRFEEFQSIKNVEPAEMTPPKKNIVCHSIGLYQMVPFSNWWCTVLCQNDLCSSWYCKCN